MKGKSILSAINGDKALNCMFPVNVMARLQNHTLKVTKTWNFQWTDFNDE